MTTEDTARPARRLPYVVLSGLGQAALIAAVFFAYRIGRHLADGRTAEAFRNARWVWDFERLTRLPSEAAVQHAALHWTGWVHTVNLYYVNVHFPATTVFLIWAWLLHRDAWPRVRNAIITSTALALVIHASFPLAPPRFIGHGLIDLMTVYGPTAYPQGPGEGMSNQYAAMPSLHVGWAILVAWGIVKFGRWRLRWLAVLYPVATTSVVVLTANHYWLDGIVGAAVVVVSIALSGPIQRLISRRGPQRT